MISSEITNIYICLNSPFLTKKKSIGDEPCIPSKSAKISKEQAPFRMVPFHTSFQYVMLGWKEVKDTRIAIKTVLGSGVKANDVNARV